MRPLLDATTIGCSISTTGRITSPDTIASFEKLTGITVRLFFFETNETRDSKY